MTGVRALAAHQRACRACRACADEGFPIASRPVFEGRAGQRALIVGQAPGIVEGEQGRPWRGRAGRTLRRWLELDDEAFVATFYCASVARCYPGRHPSGRGDRTPTRRELDLCARWLDAELALLRPGLVVTVGGLALRRLTGETALTPNVGRRLALGEAVVVPLPHPSGASGWTNDPANRERLAAAVALVHEELGRLSPGPR